jgi:hypothetical protein
MLPARRPVAPRGWLVLCGLLSLAAPAGCWVDGSPPGSSAACNNDGVCDDSESYNDCPGDCKAFRCAARRYGVFGPVKDPALALGQPDGRYADIAAGATLELYLEHLVDDQQGDDFSIQGLPAAAGGASLVQAYDHDRQQWRQVGAWSSQNSTFDLAVISIKNTDRIRVEAGSGISRLDGIVVIHCQE